MFDFIKKFIYTIMDIQEKLLSKKLKHTLNFGYSNKTSKKLYRNGATLELTSQTDKNKEKLKNNVACILKKYGNDSKKLLAFVERSGTGVYQFDFAGEILKVAGLEEGFIGETKGLKALYINILTSIVKGKKLDFTLKSKPVIILDKKTSDSCIVIKEFHKWYAMKLDLPGFDYESQNNFQKLINTTDDSKIKELSLEEILGLKEAIARDVESINFVVELAKATTGSQSALKKITAGGASI